MVRLHAFAEGAHRLLGVPPEAIASEVLQLARQSIEADGYAVWRRIDSVWHVAAAAGMDPSFAEVKLPAENTVRFDGPIVAEDVSKLPLLESRRDAYARSGVRSL